MTRLPDASASVSVTSCSGHGLGVSEFEVLESLATDDKEKYADFWKEFGRALKEGIGEPLGV